MIGKPLALDIAGRFDMKILTVYNSGAQGEEQMHPVSRTKERMA